MYIVESGAIGRRYAKWPGESPCTRPNEPWTGSRTSTAKAKVFRVDGVMDVRRAYACLRLEPSRLSPLASRLPVGEADQADLTVIRVGFVDLYLEGCAALAASVGGRVCTKAGHVRDSQHPS